MSDTKRVKIEVTRKCIDKGLCGSFQKCAIAKAVRNVVKSKVSIGVDEDGVGLTYVDKIGYDSADLALPLKARKFIQRYDDTYEDKKKKSKLKPFSFFLKIPEWFLNKKYA